RIATVNNHEVRLAQSRVVESGFEQKRIAAALSVESARAFNAMDVHREPEPPGFTRDVEEKKILKRFVIACWRFAAAHKPRVSRARDRFIRIVKIKFAKIGGFVLDRDCAVFLLTLQRRRHDLLEIRVER